MKLNVTVSTTQLQKAILTPEGKSPDTLSFLPASPDFLFPWICLFQALHVNDVTSSVAFCVWLLSLSLEVLNLSPFYDQMLLHCVIEKSQSTLLTEHFWHARHHAMCLVLWRGQPEKSYPCLFTITENGNTTGRD